MTGPDQNGKNSRSVGVALIAIVVGTSLMFSYAASDGKLFSQFFNSGGEEPSSATAETTESTAPPENMREKEPGDDQGAKSSGNNLSDEEKQRLMQAKNFPWSLASDGHPGNLAAQDALDGFKQKEPSLQSGQSAGLTTGLSILSDKAAADIDSFVLDLSEYEGDDSEQLDLTFEDDASDNREESAPTTSDTEEPASPPADQGTDEPDNSPVPDIENDTDDLPAEDEPADNDTGTSDDSGSNGTGTSENPSNSTDDE